MVFNATFNNVSVISWRSVLLVEKTTDLSQVTDKLYHIMFYTSPWSIFKLTTSVVIVTDCIGSCKSNYLTIMTTTALSRNESIKKTITFNGVFFKITLNAGAAILVSSLRLKISWENVAILQKNAVPLVLVSWQ